MLDHADYALRDLERRLERLQEQLNDLQLIISCQDLRIDQLNELLAFEPSIEQSHA
jgi:hypothetical protein